MRRFTRALLLALALAGGTAAGAEAQNGFALKGGLVFNRNDVEGSNLRSDTVPDAAGFNVGAELVLPGGIGVGISGYQAGNVSDFDLSEGTLNFLAEANYFLRLPLLPVSPYAGLHVGLGSASLSDLKEGERPRPEVDFGDLGYQIGVRFQPTKLLGIDAQYRRVSGSLAGAQDADFDTDQVLIGVTLF